MRFLVLIGVLCLGTMSAYGQSASQEVRIVVTPVHTLQTDNRVALHRGSDASFGEGAYSLIMSQPTKITAALVPDEGMGETWLELDAGPGVPNTGPRLLGKTSVEVAQATARSAGLELGIRYRQQMRTPAQHDGERVVLLTVTH